MANYNFDKITYDELQALAAIALLSPEQSQVSAARVVLKTKVSKEAKKLSLSQQVEFSEKKKELVPIAAAINKLQISVAALPKTEKISQPFSQPSIGIPETPTPE